MRSGIEFAEWDNALRSQLGITPAILAWFDFASGPVAIWTGSHPIQPTATGDTLLDGLTFEPIVQGVMVQVGDNSFSYQGSEALSLSLAIPATPTTAMAAAGIDPGEYQARTAVLWRAIMVAPPGSGAPAVWAFRRVRAGAMDMLSIANDGNEHSFTLTIEAHNSIISNATGSTYLDQKKFDPTDTSNDFATDIANNPNGPSRGANTGRGSGGGGGGFDGGGGGGGRNFNQLV